MIGLLNQSRKTNGVSMYMVSIRRADDWAFEHPYWAVEALETLVSIRRADDWAFEPPAIASLARFNACFNPPGG